MGMAHGYGKTLIYIAGICTGFFMILLTAGLLTEWISREFPRVEGVLRVVGGLYMIYLASLILRSSVVKKADPPPPSFGRGLLLQLANPKAMMFGITVFSGFLREMLEAPWQVLPAALFLTFLAYLSTSLWALFGSVIQRYLHHRPVLMTFNIGMALLLLYSAISMALGAFPGLA